MVLGSFEKNSLGERDARFLYGDYCYCYNDYECYVSITKHIFFKLFLVMRLEHVGQGPEFGTLSWTAFKDGIETLITRKVAADDDWNGRSHIEALQWSQEVFFFGFDDAVLVLAIFSSEPSRGLDGLAMRPKIPVSILFFEEREEEVAMTARAESLLFSLPFSVSLSLQTRRRLSLPHLSTSNRFQWLPTEWKDRCLVSQFCTTSPVFSWTRHHGISAPRFDGIFHRLDKLRKVFRRELSACSFDELLFRQHRFVNVGMRRVICISCSISFTTPDDRGLYRVVPNAPSFE